MSKRIIFCADGTWNDPVSNTNVNKIFNATLQTAEQICFYDSGVGTDGTPIDKLNGGAFGDGIFKKIRDGYTRIAHVYDQDDQIFIFGFSRGAYTARALAGMIAVCGLPTIAPTDAAVATCFSAYRNSDPAQRAALLASIPEAKLYNAKIAMVGVWDTVGSLGIPALFGGVDHLLFGFLDTNLHPDVLHAYHALSIDERRVQFPPTLWTNPGAGQVLEQVWFSGVHCDVGGGYAETGLSDITLSWMMGKAQGLGVQFADDAWKKYSPLFDQEHSLDIIHPSWSPKWGFPTSRSIPDGSSLGGSVLIRYTHDSTYRPTNLKPAGGPIDPGYPSVLVVA